MKADHDLVCTIVDKLNRQRRQALDQAVQVGTAIGFHIFI